jgi:hypothetical protein
MTIVSKRLVRTTEIGRSIRFCLGSPGWKRIAKQRRAFQIGTYRRMCRFGGGACHMIKLTRLENSRKLWMNCSLRKSVVLWTDKRMRVRRWKIKREQRDGCPTYVGCTQMQQHIKRCNTLSSHSDFTDCCVVYDCFIYAYSFPRLKYLYNFAA